jgi:hypothetical protein
VNPEPLNPEPRLPALPEALRAAIGRDLRAVRPLPRPAVRALAIVPVAVLLLFAAVGVFGLRQDAPQLGFLLTWLSSTLEMTLGVVLVGAALREAIPGTTLARRVVGSVFGTAAIGVLTLTWETWSASPTTISEAFGGFVWRVCVAGIVVSALPALAVSGWLVARAFPLRPRLAGALYGLGAGLMADAGWRLFCHYSEPLHVLGAHTLGVAVSCLIASALAPLLRRR